MRMKRIASLAALSFGATGFAQTAPTTAPSLVLPATVAAFYSADLYAKDSGYISDVHADIGDHVKKGQLLAVIDDPELQQQLLGAQALLAAKQELAKASAAAVEQSQSAVEVARRQLAGYQADLKLAQTTLKRQEQLFAEKAITDQQIDEIRAKGEVTSATASVGEAKIASAEADLRAAMANRSVAEAQVQIAAAEAQRLATLVSYTKIIAPFDGVITRRWVSPGDLVQSATGSKTTSLFTCQKIDTVRVFCDVPENAAAVIRAGAHVDVKIYGPAAKAIHGAITRLAMAMDPATRTMRVEIDLPNPEEKLRPGMYTQVTFLPGEP
jgi:multidrug resistance efflux pump